MEILREQYQKEMFLSKLEKSKKQYKEGNDEKI